jgi:hypothetical protein
LLLRKRFQPEFSACGVQANSKGPEKIGPDHPVGSAGEVIGNNPNRAGFKPEVSGVNYFSRSTTTISPDDDNYKLADRSIVSLH